MDDHYEVLGLEPDATPEQIKKAFKELALKYHPDQHPTAIANVLFQRIHQAYEVLSDPVRRKRYDEERNANPPRRRRATGKKRPEPKKKPQGDGRYRVEFARRTARQARDVGRAAREKNEAELRRILNDEDDQS